VKTRRAKRVLNAKPASTLAERVPEPEVYFTGNALYQSLARST
jgi:hypothetical protein